MAKAVQTRKKSKILKKSKEPKTVAKQTKILERFRRMATVIQDSNDAITFQDLEGNILAWNRGAEKIYGYSEAEALKMNIVDTVPMEYHEEARGFLASLKRGELLPNLETKRKHKDGRIIDVWLTNTKLTDDKGKLTGIATTERDITERKQSEASLREKFRELDYLREGQIALSEKMRGEQIISRLGQSILSHLVPFTNAQIGAFYIVTDDKKLQIVSAYARSKAEVAEKTIEFGEGLVGQVAIEKKALLISDVPSTYFNKIGSALGEINPRSLLICPILYENDVTGVIELGSLHPFTEHQRAFLSHVSENIGIAINTSDVRKKVQKQNEALNTAQVLLEEKASEVQRASQYKTEFLANMSHELRTPLNSSLILSKLLMDNAKGNLTDEQIKFASSIYSSGNDLLNLINDILDLSKVEAGKLDIRAESVFIPNVIESLKQTFQSLAQEKKLYFEVLSETNVPQSFFTDRQRLDQILKNLISNAFKFTQTGSIRIRIFRHTKETIGFEVLDSGIGIPKEQQEIIFEAFRQADGTTNRKYGGTGLGLSISKDLARLLGGSIKVDSAAGKGSRFTLILPESYNEVPVDAAPAKAYSIRSTASPADIAQQRHFEKALPPSFEDDRAKLDKTVRTLLVIEDEPQFSKILFDLAHEFKYKCVVAQGANEGYEMALECIPDVILLDMNLPDHIGLTTLERLKKNPKTRHIPVHVISALDYQETALNMGAFGYTLKPVKLEKIKSALRKMEVRFSRKINHVLIAETNDFQKKMISELLTDEGIEVATVTSAKDVLAALKKTEFDCIIMNLKLPDLSVDDLLGQMVRENNSTLSPVIIFTGRALSPEEENKLLAHSKSIVIKGAKSPEELLDEVILFLHRDEAKMRPESMEKLRVARIHNQAFEGKTILLVDDDIRNVFALTSALEQKGARILIGKNGHEALESLELNPKIDLVLMDIMMPEMDGLEAIRQIRKQKRFEKLPIIAVTAKTMKEDQKNCLDAGANDYLSKTVSLDKLLSHVQVWMPKYGSIL